MNLITRRKINCKKCCYSQLLETLATYTRNAWQIFEKSETKRHMYISQSKQASHMHFHSNKRQMYGSKSKQAFSYYHTFVSFDMAYKTRQDKTRTNHLTAKKQLL